MKTLFVLLVATIAAASAQAQESPETCNARAAIIKQQNQTSSTKKEVPVCPAAPTVTSSGTSSVDGKVVGGYTAYSNGVIIRTVNGVTKTCKNGVCQ